MDDYRNSMEGFDPSRVAATGEAIEPLVKVGVTEISEYSETPTETVSKPVEKPEALEIEGSYMLPKKVLVKTYKLKKL